MAPNGRGRGGGGGGGTSNKRSRADDEPVGPSKIQLKGLSWNTSAAQPAFLRNAYAALSGSSSSSSSSSSRKPTPSSTEVLDPNRPAIPTRPNGRERDDDGEDEDSPNEFDGDEAPTIVVLNQGKHIDQEEMQRLRQEAKVNSAPDPFAASKALGGEDTAAVRNGGSLRLASGNSKFKPTGSVVQEGETFQDVVKRSKFAAEVKKQAELKKINDAEKDKEKKVKDAKKEKKKQQKQKGLLSFAEE